jgi:Questin oxidase-like
MEALSLIASSYNYLHKYLDDESYTKPSPNPSTSPLELLRRLANDDRFEGLLTEQACDDCDTLYEKVKFEPLIMEYWNAWAIDDPKTEFEESQKAAVMLLVATVNDDKKEKYDFFLLHLLTTSHAVRILLPLIPGQFHINLVRQWWLLALTTYVGQLRPKFDEKLIENVDLEGKKWNYVTDKATTGPWATGEHFVKGMSLSNNMTSFLHFIY